MKQIISIICLLLFFCIVIKQSAFATFSSDIATYVSINNNQVQDGDIVSFSRQGYILSHIPYDPYMSGVVFLHPAVSLVSQGTPQTYPVVRSGTVYVRVSGTNGSIAKGDLITSSTNPGVGMKATKPGYVVGAAITSYTFTKSTDIGEIPITLDTHFYASKTTAQTSLTDVLSLSEIATYDEPLTVVRYIIVSLIVLISFVSGFFIFEKTVVKGIDALGRNPLAARMIHVGMAINIAITLAITLAGLFLAYIVLRL